MRQEFRAASKTHVNLDDKNVVRDLLHTDEPFVSAAPTPQLAAADYLSKFGAMLACMQKRPTTWPCRAAPTPATPATNCALLPRKASSTAPP